MINVELDHSESENHNAIYEEMLASDISHASMLKAAAQEKQRNVSPKEEKLEIEVEESKEQELEPILEKDSNYVTDKPNTVENKSLGDAISGNSIFDMSPINESLLGLGQVGKLNDLGSMFFALNSSSFLQGAGLYLFDSFIGRFGSGTNFDYLENDVSKFEQSRSAFTASVTSTGSGVVYNQIFGNDANDTIIGTAGADLIRGNSLSAAAPYSSDLSIYNPTATAWDEFGVSVDRSGNAIIVGARSEDTGASNAGSAYIFDAATGALLHTLNNPTPVSNDRFGQSVAIDGNFVIVAAPSDDTGASNAGSAYIYNVTTGALLHTLNNPTSAFGDSFGNSVAIDGNFAIVGGARDDTGATNAGSAYIYNVTTGALLHTLNNPTPALADSFGYSVAIEGNLVIISATGDDTGSFNGGSIYVYDATTGGLIRTISGITANMIIGDRVALDGNNLLVSVPVEDNYQGAVHHYDVTTGALIQKLTGFIEIDSQSYGYSDISISGNYAAVGAYEAYDDGAGFANGAVYIHDVSTGQVIHTITDDWYENKSGTIGYVEGGWSSSIDGNTLVVGATYAATGGSAIGAIFTYQLDFGDADVIYGGAGDDVIYGLYGNDVIYGQGGSDSLYGGSGGDRFVFELATVFDAVDTIEDFAQIEGDVIDISDVLTGYTYGVSDIGDFARFVDTGADAYLEVDDNGTAGGVNFQAAALVVGGAGLNIYDFEYSGQIDGTV